MATSRISAGNNLSIDVAPDHWRLCVNGASAERVLVEATPGQPLRYLPTFGQRRHLPDTGVLPTSYVQRVVLGWSLKDEAWHLGLVLEPELAAARGSRWCEVAHWPDPERDLYVDVATQAGTGLAQVMTRPFDLIPPRESGAAAPTVTSAPPVAQGPLPGLPVEVGDWRLEQTEPGTLVFKRAGAWARGKVVRAVWYLLFTGVYLLLSITTLQGRIALPQPEFLPYLGLASAAVLFLLALISLYQALATPNRILVEAKRGVAALRGGSERWRVDAVTVDSVYVSQVVSRKLRRNKRTLHYGELNLRLHGGEFTRLLDNKQVEEYPVAAGNDGPAEEAVVPLAPGQIETDLQRAAIHVASALNVPCWYDQRLK